MGAQYHVISAEYKMGGNAMGLDPAEFEQLRASLRRLTGNVTRAADAAPR
jgi:hypothetical protein